MKLSITMNIETENLLSKEDETQMVDLLFEFFGEQGYIVDDVSISSGKDIDLKLHAIYLLAQEIIKTEYARRGLEVSKDTVFELSEKFFKSIASGNSDVCTFLDSMEEEVLKAV